MEPKVLGSCFNLTWSEIVSSNIEEKLWEIKMADWTKPLCRLYSEGNLIYQSSKFSSRKPFNQDRAI